MKTIYTKIIIFLAILILSSCASIVTRSSYSVTINSTPSNALVTITDIRGMTVFSGNTPAVVSLSASAGFFQRAEYQIRFSNPGYDDRIISIRASIDGWYWGNILLGGFIGMLIIDPATGAMWRINTTFINETLSRSARALSQGLRIVDIADVPESWKEHLVEIK